jgi:FMN phosphatase YigB (HAD superfamily)
MLKAILFDLGSTLFDFDDVDQWSIFAQAGRNAYDYLESRGCRLPPFKQYYRMHMNEVKVRYVVSRMLGREVSCYDLLRSTARKLRLGVDDAVVRELAWLWYAPQTDHCTIASDVIPTLRKFRDRGLKMVLVSNTFIPSFVLDRHLEMTGLLEFFPSRLYSCEIGYRKPHPYIFEMALHCAGARPEEAIFVGDSVRNDILGAQRVGMLGILRDMDATSRTHHIADHVVRSLAELHQILPLLGVEEEWSVPERGELAV